MGGGGESFGENLGKLRGERGREMGGGGGGRV